MSFFTRPDLSDIQFKQISGSTLTMSGETNFKGKLKSKGVEIDATLTGATSGITGHVLTYLAGKIVLAPAGGGGDTNFDSTRATTRVGIPSVNVGGASVNQFLEGYFFPSVVPTVSISGGGTRLFGNNVGFTLSWSVTRRTQPITSITVNGTSIPSIVFNGLAVDASTGVQTQAATIATPNVNQTYPMNATTASENVPSSTSITFSHKRYFFGNNIDFLPYSDGATSTQVVLFDGGATAEFAGGKAKGTFAITLAGQYFYYVYPTTFGAAAFTINGLANTDFSFKDFAFTNQNGFSTSFRMYRTNNLLNGTFNIAVA